MTSLSLAARHRNFFNGEFMDTLEPHDEFDDGLSALADMPLTRLRMRELFVTEYNLYQLQGLPLTCLDIGLCALITYRSLPLLRSFPLTMVNVKISEDRWGMRIEKLRDGMEELEELQKVWDETYGAVDSERYWSYSN